MRKLKAGLLVAAATVLCLAQSATEYEGPSVMRVAARLNCDCGCKLRMDCQMQPKCHICKAARIKILEMQQQGKSDQQIIDSFVAEKGPDVLAIPPGTFGSLASYGALAIGLGMVLLTLRKYLKPRPAPAGAPAGPASDALLDKYQSEIEKDMEKLD